MPEDLWEPVTVMIGRLHGGPYLLSEQQHDALHREDEPHTHVSGERDA